MKTLSHANLTFDCCFVPCRENRRPYDETTNDDIKNLLENNTENINTAYKEVGELICKTETEDKI